MKNLMISPNLTINQALKAMSKSGGRCVVVVNDENEMIGTLSDGDLRRAILKGARLDDSITSTYNQSPQYFFHGKYSIKNAKEIFLKYKYEIIPVVNEEKLIVDILIWDQVFSDRKNIRKITLDVPIVIMAGGKGARLKPFTNILPKPLIPVHEKPIIEHIIERFTEVGCTEFYLTVNYKAKIIKAYFEEMLFDYHVHFVEEQDPLGTAGSLRYLNGKFKQPFFVTNCDTVIKADYVSLYDFHNKGGYDVTLVASAKEYIIPFGTCELNSDGHLSHINEKPQYDFLINTGLYILNPDVLKIIPKNKFYHITHLIEDAKEQGKKVGVFPIDDDAWIDVGQWAEYRKAVEKF